MRPLTSASLIIVGLLAFVLRRPGLLTKPVLFAEDGIEFFRFELREGAGSLNNPYGGCLVLLQRLGALVGALFPYAVRPLVYALYASCWAVGSCALVLRSAASDVFGSQWWRAGLFGALVLSPHVAETHGRLTNIPWWTGLGLMILAFSTDPVSKLGKLGELSFVILAGFSALFIVVAIPFAGWRVWRRRSSWSLMFGSTWGAVACVQLLVLRTQDRPISALPSIKLLGAVFIRQWFGPSTVGSHYVSSHQNVLTGPAWSKSAWIAVLVVFVLVSALAFLSGNKLVGLLLVFGGTVQIIAGFVAVGSLAFMLPDRYTLGPIACLAMLVVAARPDQLHSAVTKWTGLALRILLGALIVLSLPRNFRVPVEPGGKSFEAAATCLESKNPNKACQIPAVPPVFSFGVAPNEH